MSHFKFHTEFWVPAELEKVWHFHQELKNYAQMSPGKGAEVLPEDVKLLLDSEFSFSFSGMIPLLNKKTKWHGKVSEFSEEENECFFVDEMVKGPFSYWKHKHFFKKSFPELNVGGGGSTQTIKARRPGTWIIDTVEYSLLDQEKFYAFGEKYIDPVLTKKMLARFFNHRQQELVRIFS